MPRAFDLRLASGSQIDLELTGGETVGEIRRRLVNKFGMPCECMNVLSSLGAEHNDDHASVMCTGPNTVIFLNDKLEQRFAKAAGALSFTDLEARTAVELTYNSGCENLLRIPESTGKLVAPQSLIITNNKLVALPESVG